MFIKIFCSIDVPFVAVIVIVVAVIVRTMFCMVNWELIFNLLIVFWEHVCF